MSEFGVWLKEVDDELSSRVRNLSWTNARSAAIGFWANLPIFMNLYSMWQNNRNVVTAVNYLIGGEQ